MSLDPWWKRRQLATRAVRGGCGPTRTSDSRPPLPPGPHTSGRRPSHPPLHPLASVGPQGYTRTCPDRVRLSLTRPSRSGVKYPLFWLRASPLTRTIVTAIPSSLRLFGQERSPPGQRSRVHGGRVDGLRGPLHREPKVLPGRGGHPWCLCTHGRTGLECVCVVPRTRPFAARTDGPLVETKGRRDSSVGSLCAQVSLGLSTLTLL